jgi:hypothetical protein
MRQRLFYFVSEYVFVQCYCSVNNRYGFNYTQLIQPSVRMSAHYARTFVYGRTVCAEASIHFSRPTEIARRGDTCKKPRFVNE